MAQPPDPGRDTGPEPARDPGLPGGGAGVGSWVGDAGRAERLAVFASGRAGDRFPPGSWLAMLVDELSGPDRRCPGTSDDALIGLLGRWQALESWASAGKLGVVAELARRRARPGHQNRRPAGLPSAWEEGTGHEVAAALGMSLPGADDLLALAVGLQARLPRIYGLLAAGTLDYIKAKIIADELAVLDDALAAQAGALIADQLAGKTPGQVRKLAAAAVVTVDPRGAEKRREAAERETARVRFWREAAGTAALAAYGLPTDAALAANANIAARARQYKQAKLMGSMDQLRVMGYLDILNGVAAQDRIARARAEEQARAAAARAGSQAGGGAPTGSDAGAAGNGPSGDRGPAGGRPTNDRSANDDLAADDDLPADDEPGGRPADDLAGDDQTGDDEPGDDRAGNDDPWDDDESWDWGPPEDGPGYQWLGNDGPWDDDDDPDADGPGDGEPGDDLEFNADSPGGGVGPGAGPPGDDHGPELAASINLTLPLQTVQRLADRPGHGHGLGPLDPALARDLAAAAARSPHSTWCLTITSPQGYAIGHGCARPARHQRGKAPPPGSRAGPWTLTRNHDDPGPPGGYGTWTLTLPGGRDYTIRLGPIPVTDCDHRHESRGYQPGATLRHLVQVRDGTCTFPPCSRHARESDFEHAVPYDQGGRTCGCNAGARSRRCHQVKQSAGWTVTQPLPGWHQWTTPSGRTYTQEPMKYPA